MKQKLKTTFKILLNILIGLIVVIAAAVTIISLSTQEKGISNVGGYIPFSIQTESMEPEIKSGDLIITEKYEEQELNVGDVISFFSLVEDQVVIKTHRIIEKKENETITSYVTKGDSNLTEDDVEVAPGDIVAVYGGFKISYLGRILDFFKSRFGFLFFIILPLFAFFLYEIYTFVTLIVEMKKEPKK